MPALIRYPFFGCVALFLAACGSSGSSTLYNPNPSPGEDSGGGTTGISASYPDVDYLITDIPAAIAKFATDTSMDTSEGEDMDEESGEDMDEESQATTDTGARALMSTVAQLNNLRISIINSSTRYLSTGAVLARTDDNDSVVTERPMNAMQMPNCADATATGPAKCDFAVDSLRDATTFHLGSASSSDENRVSFRSFMADREPVMIYRQALLSQVRTTGSEETDLKEIFEDEDGNEYLLTSDNVMDMVVPDEAVPTGVTTAPAFVDLLAVYEDEDGNEYLLTSDNVMDMVVPDGALPTGVTTAPAFTSLSKVRESQEGGDEEYVGYDGMLQYSMFFVGVQRFFDEEGELQHARFDHASLGRIYDEDAIGTGIQSPSVALTGEGVMVGMERRKINLEHHLVQGDVEITYEPWETPAEIDIAITNIRRLADDKEAWYASVPMALTWEGVEVTGSKFSFESDFNPSTQDRGALRGSFYGTEADPEVGGVFHHEDIQYEIVGSFGSKLDPEPEDSDQ